MDLGRPKPVITLLGAAALILALILTPACGRAGGAAPVIGIKIYEASPPYAGLIRQWRDLGINTLFVSEALLLNADFRVQARAAGLTLFLIYPVFQSPEAIAEDPAIAAVTASGAPAREDWVEFVCPTKGEAYLEGRIGRLREVVAAGDPDVVSLDFIRFFVFWEKVAPDRTPGSLPQTCFCPACLSRFGREMAIDLPGGSTAEMSAWILARQAEAWTEWKCRTIAGTVERLAAAARRAKPAVKINLHTVPWRHDDFGGAARSVAGQDPARLAPLVDLLSPMAYHHMVRRSPAWVHDVVADASAETRGAAILPSIQVAEAYVEQPLSAVEFAAALAEALKPPSAGVVLWSWEALSKAPEKQALLKRAAH